MRKRFNPPHDSGAPAIGDVYLSKSKRNKSARLLRGLQYIFTDSDTHETVFTLMEEFIGQRKLDQGRPGMSLWEILVLGVYRVGMDMSYDRLEDQVNNHRALRGILGLHALPDSTGYYKVYSLQSLKDNLGLFDESLLKKLNRAIIKSGHKLVKKRGRHLR